MPNPSSSLAIQLANRFRQFERTRSKIDHLTAAGQLGQRDADRSYEGLFLMVHVTFERFLEELFIGLLYIMP